jgi:hypothetical protein
MGGNNTNLWNDADWRTPGKKAPAKKVDGVLVEGQVLHSKEGAEGKLLIAVVTFGIWLVAGRAHREEAVLIQRVGGANETGKLSVTLRYLS